MKDGNKEATKELLGTFRIVFTASVSIALVTTNFQLRGQLVAKNILIYYLAIGLLALCSVLSMLLFLLTIPKLYNEENAIPYQPQLVFTGSIAIVTFVAGVISLVWSQL